MANWQFAMHRVILAPVASPSGVRQYAYALPSDCIDALRILPIAVEFAVLLDNGRMNWPALDYLFDERGSRDFTIEGDLLLTQEPEAVLKYKRDVTDPTSSPAQCLTAFGMMMASYLAGPIIKGQEGTRIGASWRESAMAMTRRARRPRRTIPASIRGVLSRAAARAERLIHGHAHPVALIRRWRAHPRDVRARISPSTRRVSRSARNFRTLPHRTAERRPGFRSSTRHSTPLRRCGFIPFAFNATQTVVLEFGDLYIRFHINGATLLESNKTVTSIVGNIVTTSTAHGYTAGNWVYSVGRYFVVGVTGSTTSPCLACAGSRRSQHQARRPRRVCTS